MVSTRRTLSQWVGRSAVVVVAALAALIAAGGAGAAQDGSAALLVTWETIDGSTFKTVVTDPPSIALIEAAFPGDGHAGIPTGTLVAGDGGVNAPHEWHMVDVVVAELTIELCDGTATMVDDDLDYWLNTVGVFCPWSAVVIAVEPYGDPEPTPAPTIEPTAEPTAAPTAGPTTEPTIEPTAAIGDPTAPAGDGASTLPSTGAGSVPVDEMGQSPILLGLVALTGVIIVLRGGRSLEVIRRSRFSRSDDRMATKP